MKDRDLFMMVVQAVIVWAVIELLSAMNRQLIINDLVRDFRKSFADHL